MIEKLKAMGYTMNELINILIREESKKCNLLRIQELVDLQEELKNKEDDRSNK